MSRGMMWREGGCWTVGEMFLFGIATLRREGWFSNHVSHSVGNGKFTLFWLDVWVGGVSFRARFSRLFDLLVCKDESVFDMCQLRWEG